jgi:hypothetical protein
MYDKHYWNFTVNLIEIYMAKSVRKGQSEKQTVNQLFKEMTLMNIK